MARGSDPGKDFDAQYNASRRKGQEKAARGETHWAEDKYLERINAERSRDHGRHAGEPKGCSDKAAALVAIGLGIGYAVTEVIRVAL